jgi:hypothetical protein
MGRDHFSQMFQSPYFQSEAYRNTPAGRREAKIAKIILAIKNKIFFWKSI